MSGESAYSIAKTFNAEGIGPPAARTWSSTMVAKMLRNPRYAGMVSYAGKHRIQAATAGDGWSVVLFDDEGRPLLGSWEPIVTPKLWSRFQFEWQRRRQKAGIKPGDSGDLSDAGGGGVPGGERIHTPPLLDGFEHRGVVQRHAVIGDAEDGPGRDERGIQHCGHAHPESGEVETGFSGRLVGRCRAGGRWHMVVTTAVLVIGDDQQGLVPVRSGAQRVVHVEDELFALRDVIVGVLAVSVVLPGGLQEGERGE
ncbi:hypothetical protein SNA_20385 [Streptomyces natalensis ATCC 27448]|uniref:Recombinase domain-containing protein n=1 Tax=Streptomyces natalensis ATCC 27448 TaxID=1240678 RepID=A0A0D7CJJ3_9ACTN|nr:hypothetical protein SNA_20385 [Streptomyces natalensis ATCC 27448]